MSVHIKTILDTRRVKNKGTYPIKLRVTYNRETQYYPTIYSLSLDDHEKLTASRLNSDLQKIREDLKKITREAGGIADDMGCFSFSDFELNYISDNPLFAIKKAKKRIINPGQDENGFDFSEYYKKFSILKETQLIEGTILPAYVKYIKTLLQQGRIGSALTYQDSYNSLNKFKGNVVFNDITETYLYQYEQWMLGRNLSKSTVGVKLRPLRAVFNMAMDDKIVKRDRYPFGKRKYQIPTSRNVKKAFHINDVSSIYYYEPVCEGEDMAKDFWLFLYFANGMNPKDVALLKRKSIQGDFFTFERAKTIRTARSNPKPITVYITDDMWKIIDKRGNKDKSPDSYLFPILSPGLTLLQQHYAIKHFVKMSNDWMAEIGKKLGFSKKPTAITSRHTFSTIMKRSGASIEFIQEALGHYDKKTTENYLDGFENDQKKEYAKRLSAFKKDQFL